MMCNSIQHAFTVCLYPPSCLHVHSDYPAPRLAAGSFADVVKMLYEKLCGEELQITAVLR